MALIVCYHKGAYQVSGMICRYENLISFNCQYIPVQLYSPVSEHWLLAAYARCSGDLIRLVRTCLHRFCVCVFSVLTQSASLHCIVVKIHVCVHSVVLFSNCLVFRLCNCFLLPTHGAILACLQSATHLHVLGLQLSRFVIILQTLLLYISLL